MSSPTYSLAYTIVVSAQTGSMVPADVTIECVDSQQLPNLLLKIYDETGATFDVTGGALAFTVYKFDGTVLFARTTTAAQITISTYQVTVTFASTSNTPAGAYRWELTRTDTAVNYIGRGHYVIHPIGKP